MLVGPAGPAVPVAPVGPGNCSRRRPLRQSGPQGPQYPSLLSDLEPSSWRPLRQLDPQDLVDPSGLELSRCRRCAGGPRWTRGARSSASADQNDLQNGFMAG